MSKSFFPALPEAPPSANTTAVHSTRVVIRWQRSPDDNGKITYALDCFRCKSGESKNCKEACDRQVRYIPGKDNITGVNVTVHGLSPSSFYLFRVYSVSELNQLESNKDKWRYVKVFVETKGIMCVSCILCTIALFTVKFAHLYYNNI